MPKIEKIKALGTYWWVEIFEEVSSFELVETTILDEIQAFEQNYSRFLDSSQIAILNRQRFIQNPSSELINLLQIGLDLFQKTEGYFNPVLGSVLENLGYDKNYSFQFKSLQKTPNLENFITFEESKITLNREGNWDLGGYAKGYLGDKLVDILQAKFGIKNFLINGGGDILVKGDLSKEIILENPFKPGYQIGKIILQNSALGASSTQKRNWKSETKNQNFSHIFNPIQNQPVQKSASFVISKNALEADALATVICLIKDTPKLIQKLKNNFQFEYLVW